MVIQKLTFIFIVLAPLVTPIGYNGAMMPDLYRGAYFQIGVLFLAAMWFLQQINLKKRKIIYSGIEIPILAFLTWSTLSLLWVDDYFEALKLLTIWWCAGLLYFLVMQVFRDRQSIHTLSLGIVISGALIALIGISQHLFDLDWIVQAKKPAATFGNRNMAVHFLVMVIPLSIGLLLHVKHKAQKMIIAVSLLLMMLYLFYTNSQAGFLSLFIQIVLFALFVLKNRKSGLNKQHAALAAIVIALSLIITSFSIRPVDALGRIGSIFTQISTDYQSLNERIPMWLNTLGMVKNNPVLGVGAGNWRIHYPHYLGTIFHGKEVKDIEITEVIKGAKMHQHAHNDWLEILSSLGIVGFAFLIWVMFVVGRLVYRHLNNHQDFLVLGLSLGLIGVLVDGFFTFPLKLVIAPLLLAVFIALLTVLTQPDQNNRILQLPLPLIVISMSFFLLSGSWSVVKNNQWLKAQVHYSNSLVHQRNGLYDHAKREAIKSVELNPSQALHRFNLSAILLKLKEYDDVIKHGSLILEARPYHYPTIAVMAQAFLADQRQDKALEYLERLASIIKTHSIVKHWLPVFYAQQASEQIARQDYVSLEQVYKKWINIAPTAVNYQNLAVILYNSLGRQKEGVKYFKKALSLDPDLPQADRIRELIRHYEQSNSDA